jgi:hypothetical protein
MSNIWRIAWPHLALLGVVAAMIAVAVASEYALWWLARWPYLALALVGVYAAFIAAASFRRR